MPMVRQAFWAAMLTASVKAGKANCITRVLFRGRISANAVAGK